jgi:hypothetical protein
MTLTVFYRFCEETSGVKPRPPNFCKRACLENFLECFPTSNVFLVADGVTDETYAWLRTKVSHVERTEMRNGGKVFTYVVRRAMKELQPHDHVYFVEDDYIHLPGSEEVLMEGLEFGDYVTLYDCPDKYIDHITLSQFDGTQVMIEGGGEVGRIIQGPKTFAHWKETTSTTLTFATRVENLATDYVTLFQWSFQSGDFNMFYNLTRRNGRRLINAIPGLSTHCHMPWITRNRRIFELLGLHEVSLELPTSP